jgi:dihydrofolate reductase
MILSLIVAADENGVIGRENRLPWNLPDDLRYFREKTKHHPVIMGRKTYDSIGRPLPHRPNIVVSRQPDLQIEGCTVVSSLGEALLRYVRTDEEVFIIGGAEMFREALAGPLNIPGEGNLIVRQVVDVIYLTRVHTKAEGDVYFPPLQAKEWKLKSTKDHPADEHHAYPFTFEVYERKSMHA